MIKANETLHCEGLACPMPVVKTKKAIENLKAGEVLQIVATDKGSVADLKSWATRSGHQYIGVVEEHGQYVHYIRKACQPTDVTEDAPFSATISNEQLLTTHTDYVVIDVREEAEYAFGHLETAISIPFGELEQRLTQLDKNQKYAIICRTGTRSSAACYVFKQHGFEHIYNVIPGMQAMTHNLVQNI